MSKVMVLSKRKVNSNSSRKSQKRKSHSTGDGATFTLEMAVPRSILKHSMNSIHTILQNYSYPSFFSTSTSNPTYGSVAPNLALIDQYVSLIAVFDQYRIVDVEMWLTPQTSADVSARQGLLYSVLDYDDSTALASTAAYTDYDTCVISPQSNGHYRHFAPHVANALYAPSTFTSFGNVVSPWIDTSSYSVAHYGVKFAATASTTGPQVYDLRLRMKIQFRAVR
jgi:hypothetical protein